MARPVLMAVSSPPPSLTLEDAAARRAGVERGRRRRKIDGQAKTSELVSPC